MPRYLHLATAAAAALGRAAAQNDTAAPTMEPTDSPDGAAVATVNPAALYSLDRAMPLGATCKEVNVEDGDCDLFAADCLCDVTAGACDLNCCCDTDCDALQIAQFEMRGACVDTGRTFTNECYSAQDTGLASVNARYPMSSSSTADAALDGLFCVMYVALAAAASNANAHLHPPPPPPLHTPGTTTPRRRAATTGGRACRRSGRPSTSRAGTRSTWTAGSACW